MLTAPQGNLVQEGETFNPETAVDSLLKRLENSPGMADNIAVIRYYAEHVEFKELAGMESPVAYGPGSDMIRYNPKLSLPAGADQDGIFAHELAHQADKWYYNVTGNPEWADAIQKAEASILKEMTAIQSWFIPGGKYFDNAFFSDIVSAISKGTVDTPYSHDENYWSISGNREREIFANMVVLDILYGVDTIPHDAGFEPICKVFRKIINGGTVL